MSELTKKDAEQLLGLLASYKRAIVTATLPDFATICAVEGMEGIVNRDPSFIHVDIAIRQFINSISEGK